jgi:hypothetical protein
MIPSVPTVNVIPAVGFTPAANFADMGVIAGAVAAGAVTAEVVDAGAGAAGGATTGVVTTGVVTTGVVTTGAGVTAGAGVPPPTVRSGWAAGRLFWILAIMSIMALLLIRLSNSPGVATACVYNASSVEHDD